MDVVHVTPQVREKLSGLTARIVEMLVEERVTPVEAAAALHVCNEALSEMYGMRVTLLASAKGETL